MDSLRPALTDELQNRRLGGRRVRIRSHNRGNGDSLAPRPEPGADDDPHAVLVWLLPEDSPPGSPDSGLARRRALHRVSALVPDHQGRPVDRQQATPSGTDMRDTTREDRPVPAFGWVGDILRGAQRPDPGVPRLVLIGPPGETTEGLAGAQTGTRPDDGGYGRTEVAAFTHEHFTKIDEIMSTGGTARPVQDPVDRFRDRLPTDVRGHLADALRTVSDRHEHLRPAMQNLEIAIRAC